MDNLIFSLSVALLGILVVFVGLVLLIFCIMGITKLANLGSGKQKKEKKAAPAPAAAPAPVAAPVVETGAVSPEVIAAITAAISAVWDGAQSGFVVKHVRRISNAPVWSRAGREEQTYSRF